MVDKSLKIALSAATIVGFALAAPDAAWAAAPPHGSHASRAHASRSGVRFARRTKRGGTQALVNDGRGTGFGFHRLPSPYRLAAARQRHRQADAVRQAVIDDALTSGGSYGFYGDSVYGEGNDAAYGVFDGADGYGSPYFAGYYGPGDGVDYGPFGHAYAD